MNDRPRRSTSPALARPAPGPGRPSHPLIALQQAIGNQAVHRWLGSDYVPGRAWHVAGGSGPEHSEAEADRVGDAVADAITPPVESAAHGHDDSGHDDSGEHLAPALRGPLETFLGWDLGAVRVHAGASAAGQARGRGARAFTTGNDIRFGRAGFQPHTRAGLRVLGHELAHVRQQSVGLAPWARIQRKEDWDFTPADYSALQKGKKELTFGADSAWFPKALQDNLLATLKFTLTSTKPVRTAGVNVKDFYHGHFVVPKGKKTPDMQAKGAEFVKKSEQLQGAALGGNYFDPITQANLPAYTKAMQATETAATPILQDALKIKGAAVIYHTYEVTGPSMKPGSPTRNIRTPIGGSPAGYDPSGTEKSANQYSDEYSTILQFAFLVDEAGVIHVTVGTTSNLSRVTGTPMD
jgi:hypothetical protein